MNVSDEAEHPAEVNMKEHTESSDSTDLVAHHRHS